MYATGTTDTADRDRSVSESEKVVGFETETFLKL